MVNVDGRTDMVKICEQRTDGRMDRRTNKRTETCTPKSPMLKQVRQKWPYLLNCEEYCDGILHTHWYWQDVANAIVKWHLGLPRFKIWKKWNLPYLLNLLVHFDKILHTHYCWHDLDRGIAQSSPRDCKMTFNIGRGCAELQILKKWKWPNWADCCDETLHTHWYWQGVAQEIVKCHLGLAEALPRFKFWKTVKLALSLETFWIFW